MKDGRKKGSEEMDGIKVEGKQGNGKDGKDG